MDATTRSTSAGFTAPAGSGELAPAKTLLLTRSDIERLLARCDEITAFDSPAAALQDAAAAAAVRRRAVGRQQGVHFSFNT